ncbi:endothelin-converting enzyme homolog [Saccoglossus kowalevskii]
MEEIDENSEVICYGPDYLELANELVNVTSDRILHNFMMWKLLDSVAYYLSDPFRDQYTKFHNLLDGKSGKRERWKECQDECNIVFDMAVGAMFVREAFSEDDKAEVEVMIQDIKDAYIDELPNIDWMDDESRSKAEAKAKLMGYEIGYPDYILNTTELDARWEGFEVNRTQFFVNRMSFHRHRNEGTMKWIFKEPNPDEWYLPPQIVNAYYDPTTNNMTFLAGILQSPMYNPRYTMAFNYGAIGMVMGHELTHGFDTIGGMYNHEGALIPGGWYTEETTEGFLNETECVVDLYNSYCMPPWTDLGCIDGELTKSENIADLGGIKQAFYAYNNYYLARNLDVGLIPGFRSNDEVLFLAFSQGWCNKYTTEYLEQMLVSDPHSPAMYRVIGPLSNFEEFGSLYGCTTNDEMNREDKCSVW